MPRHTLAAQPYRVGLAELRTMVDRVEKEVIDANDQAQLVTDNMNFFTKAFLISLCAYLEMCVKAIASSLAKELEERVRAAKIPLALVEWKYEKKRKGESSSGAKQHLSVQLTSKDLDDLISGNVYRTRDALALLGIDLAANKAEWEGWKELVQSIVTRRNNIVHHNDSASDLSFGDIRGYISNVEAYIDYVSRCCEAFE